MLKYIAGLSFARKIQLAVGLVTIGGAGAMLVIYVEAWTVRDRYRDLVASNAMTADAFDLAVSTAAYSQNTFEYIEKPIASQRARMVESARELAHRLRAIRGRASSDDERRWGSETQAIHERLIAQGDELVALHDLVRVSHDRVNQRLADAARAAAGHARVGRAIDGLRLAAADYVRTRGAVERDLFGQARADLIASARAAGPAWPAVRLVELAESEAQTLAHHVEGLGGGWSRFVGLRDQLSSKLAASLKAQLMSRSQEAANDVGTSIARLSIAAILLTAAGVIAGLGAVLILRALVLRPLRELAEGAAAIGSGRLDYHIRARTLDEVGQVAMAFNDMTARLRAHHGALEDRIEERTRELMFLVNHDALTGLVNRAGFGQSLEDALKMAQRRRETLAVLLLDLDGFKSVNDTLGHEQGDHLLREVGRRLRTQCREVDVVARLGGDEFCILLSAVGGIHGAAEVAERLLVALLAPVELLGRSVTPRASIGIAMFPDDARDAVGLLRTADTAMYAAKQAGKHRYQFYAPRMTRDVEEQMAVEAELRAAVDHGAFELLYQPKVALASGRLIGVEALIRWPRRGRGLVAPDAFIPTVERLGLIEPLGDWVLRTACDQARAWQRAGLAPFDIAVNISPTHFGSPTFVERVEKILTATGLDPRWLEIELTESVMRDSPLLGDVCRRLRELGVRIAIDDFGAGFSSLTALKHTPIDTLKIDRQFVQGLLDDREAPLLLGTVLGMAGGLQLTTVAEGVETLHQVQVLQALGCAAAQGYFFSPPVPADSIPALARAAFFLRVAAG
ncbi:MAG: putative bifunctional diguanylate cyclase/phosphodiesterase [Vicinamibacterales bacterium]